MGLKDELQQPKPMVKAVPYGTVMALGNSGDINQDIVDALDMMDADSPYSKDDIRRIRRYEQISAGLREEANMSSGSAITLWWSSCKLKSGAKLSAWLCINKTNAGDAVYWFSAIGSDPSIPSINAGHRATFDVHQQQLTLAGGGPSDTAGYANWADVPSDRELNQLG